MIRNTIRPILMALVAAFVVSSGVEAAAKKGVRHRPKHSSRVAVGGPPPVRTAPVVTASTTASKSKPKAAKRAAAASRGSAAKRTKKAPATKLRTKAR